MSYLVSHVEAKFKSNFKYFLRSFKYNVFVT